MSKNHRATTASGTVSVASAAASAGNAAATNPITSRPYGQATPFYGCHNRADFRTTFMARDSAAPQPKASVRVVHAPVRFVRVPFQNSMACQYKDSDLGRIDPRCGLGKLACSQKQDRQGQGTTD